MGISIQERQLIDRYLQGELSGIELGNFIEHLNTDESFRKEVELQRLIYHGIQRAGHEKLKVIIRSSLHYRKPVIPFALKMTVTFLLITGLGISLWLYVGNESVNEEQTKSWFAFLNNKRNDADQKVEPGKLKQDVPRKAVVVREPDSLAVEADSSPDSSVLKTSKDETAADTGLNKPAEDDIVVKQDQLLISATLPVEEKSEVKDETLSNETVQKLNPAADLPANEKSNPNCLVEFWVSPINYKGYKMSKNKLILFGIDEPDAVKLYRVDDALYMSYLKEFYRLNNSFDFVSYQKLKDSEIPLAIR